MTNNQGLKQLTGFMNEYLTEETAVLNVSTEPFKTMGCGNWFLTATQKYGLWQLVPVRYCTGEIEFLSLLRVTRGDNEI